MPVLSGSPALFAKTENDDKVALNRFKETLNYENGRYVVTWPWKMDGPDLPDNHGLALEI